MKKIVIVFVLGFGLLGCATQRTATYGTIGGAAAGGIAALAKGTTKQILGATALGAAAGAVAGAVLDEFKGVPKLPPPPPPSPSLSYPSSYPSPAPPALQQYSYVPVLPWQGVKVAVSDRGGRGDEASVRGTVIDALRSWGAEVIVISGHGSQSGDAPYVLEIQTRSEGNRAVVDLWFFERATRAVRLHGRAAEFYYDGSDRWRSFQWATSRALANLR